VGSIAAIFVVILGVLVLTPSEDAPAYATTRVETRTVVLTAQGTGTVVDARVDSFMSDGTRVVTQRDGTPINTSAVPNSTVTISTIDVTVGQAVTAGQRLGAYVNANNETIVVTTPDAGVVRSVPATVGTRTGGALFTVGVGGLRVATPISQYDVANVTVDQVVAYTYSALDTTGKGAVVSIGTQPIAQADTSTSAVTKYLVLSTLVEPPATLRVGMSVQTSIEVRRADGVTTIPLQALVEGIKGNYTVLKVDANGVANPVEVKVGIIGDTYVEITEGLSVGDLIANGASSTDTPAVVTEQQEVGGPL
jgi:macrolide-specific efflux system membrane fusion protein